jgi:hypothetical protein
MWWKYAFMYENGKMKHAEHILLVGGGEHKGD